jgi:molecular chaperone DnaK (HSP70)
MAAPPHHPALDSPLLEDNAPSRYVVGVDLGTTNSAVCYIDTAERPWRVRVLEIPQLIAPGQVEARDTLPSFHYQPLASELAGNHFQLPWSVAAEKHVVGFMARDYGSGTPGRQISSAKSWLCHSGVDRTAELLPWHSAADVERISPVEASSRYLAHVRAAWNHRFRTEPLERQEIVLTLPASFDEIARELTVQAAARAGLARVVLAEEPQAAFYAWIYKHEQQWAQLVTAGQTILVCDIGGGTTDFTLICVRQGEQEKVQFHRVAVGDHLILGGDNMDLALAQHLEVQLAKGEKFAPRQWDVLLRAARAAKEQLLASDGAEQVAVSVPGSGSKLIGGNLQATVKRSDVERLILDGFFPRVALSDKPAARRSGFQEFGLPYAADPAISRYLAAFLTAHRQDTDASGAAAPNDMAASARPDVILFNGGVFASNLLRERLLELLGDWFSPAGGERWQPQVLDNDRLDLAVARGAAYYGMVRRGEGVKIVATLARTYYIGVEASLNNSAAETKLAKTSAAAICLVPATAEPGQTIDLAERQFDLLVSEPVEFPLYTSSVRLTDQPGQLVQFDPEQMSALPPIRTALKTRSRRERGVVAVQLHARLTEIGTIDLWCSEVGGERSWRLQFDVRSATQTDVAAHQSAGEALGFLDEQTAEACRAVLDSVFGTAGGELPDSINARLVEAAESERAAWPMSLLRRLWEQLMELEAGRRKSAQHEARWLNLLGYTLRPGYGLAVDDWRVAETWKTVQGKLAHPAATSRTESVILWRRIAGGLSLGQQRALAEPLLATVRAWHKRQTSGSGKASDPTFSPHEAVEVLRLLGSLELLPVERKVELGGLLADLLARKKLANLHAAVGWGFARLAARQPAYGPLNAVVAPEQVVVWIDHVLKLDLPDTTRQFMLVQMARHTGDRYRDVPPPTTERVCQWLTAHGASEHALQLVREGGELDTEEQDRVFGEALPRGLRIGADNWG